MSKRGGQHLDDNHQPNKHYASIATSSSTGSVPSLPPLSDPVGMTNQMHLSDMNLWLEALPRVFHQVWEQLVPHLEHQVGFDSRCAKPILQVHSPQLNMVALSAPIEETKIRPFISYSLNQPGVQLHLHTATRHPGAAAGYGSSRDPSTNLNINTYVEVPIWTHITFHHAVAQLFCQAVTTELNRGSFADISHLKLFPIEILKRILPGLGAAILAGTDEDLDLVQGQAVFQAIEQIAALPYESAEAKGYIVLQNQLLVPQTLVTFINPVSLFQARTVRKLLEMTSNKQALFVPSGSLHHFDSQPCVTGLVVIDDKAMDAAAPVQPGTGGRVAVPTYSSNLETVRQLNAPFKWVQIIGRNHWKYGEGSWWPVMSVNNGRIRAHVQPNADYKERFEQTLQHVFPDTHGFLVDRERLWSYVEEAMKQRHGTMLVISTAAQDEAQRLAEQSTPIEPIKLTADIIHGVSAIDGAILVDTVGVCHAVGVILDGIAFKNKGDPGRGARYNSAIRYVHTCYARGEHVVAVVISEDGGINIIQV